MAQPNMIVVTVAFAMVVDVEAGALLPMIHEIGQVRSRTNAVKI
jgi:hypothetical protein